MRQLSKYKEHCPKRYYNDLSIVNKRANKSSEFRGARRAASGRAYRRVEKHRRNEDMARFVGMTPPKVVRRKESVGVS